MVKGRILSGMRPTGTLHIGHLSVLQNWVQLQEDYNCYYTIADLHALTTAYDEAGKIEEYVREMLLDWLSVGIDPERSVVFVQSQVKEHAELHLLLSMVTPLSWLERVPTYKEQIQQFRKEGKDISTYGFLGYPLLQAADIMVYRADAVPVGEDQLPHLELCREIVRRFNYLYQTKLFPEPQAKLSRVSVLPGVDGRKMSKSYNNDIPINCDPQALWARVRMMVTDPERIHVTDLGHPDVCTVFAYQQMYAPQEIEEIREECEKARIGCVACKQKLAEKMNEVLEPIRERRSALEADEAFLKDVLAEGGKRAHEEAGRTMEQVRELMGVN